MCNRLEAGWGSQTYRFEDSCGIFVEPGRVDDFIIQYGLKKVIFVLGLKGCMSAQHLIKQHAHGPPVYCRSVQHLLKDLYKGGSV